MDKNPARDNDEINIKLILKIKNKTVFPTMLQANGFVRRY